MPSLSFRCLFKVLLCGNPVIVIECCEYLVHYDNMTGLSNALRSSLEHLNANRKMVEAGRRYIEENLTRERTVKQVEAMYEDCVCNV